MIHQHLCSFSFQGEPAQTQQKHLIDCQRLEVLLLGPDYSIREQMTKEITPGWGKSQSLFRCKTHGTYTDFLDLACYCLENNKRQEILSLILHCSTAQSVTQHDIFIFGYISDCVQ